MFDASSLASHTTRHPRRSIVGAAAATATARRCLRSSSNTRARSRARARARTRAKHASPTWAHPTRPACHNHWRHPRARHTPRHSPRHGPRWRRHAWTHRRVPRVGRHVAWGHHTGWHDVPVSRRHHARRHHPAVARQRCAWPHTGGHADWRWHGHGRLRWHPGPLVARPCEVVPGGGWPGGEVVETLCIKGTNIKIYNNTE